MMTLRRRLLLTLLPALLLLTLLGGAADYWIASGSTRDAYDSALASAALALSASLRASNGQLLFDRSARSELSLHPAFFRIVGAGGLLIAGDSELPVPPATNALSHSVFADVSYHGQNLRVASVRVQTDIGPAIVTVAESRDRRQRTQLVMLYGKLLVDFAELDITLLLIWFAVYYGLRPLEKLREQVEASQSFNTLRRLDETQVPGELRSTVISFNRVLELLQDAAAVQQRFIADAAHQLRTPIAGLLAQMELLIKDPRAAAFSTQIVNIQGGIHRLAHSANQLLALARADPISALYENFVPVALPALVETLVLRHVERADQAGIDLGADARPASVLGDVLLLEDLLGNLIDNALKYTPAGGYVTVRCAREQARAVLEVEDSGPGIPVADRQRVKERFYRLPGSPGMGCGLGLAIVEEIARLHQGNFTISTGAQECGCVMRVTFPAA